MPHLDEHERIQRAHAAELSRGSRVARDRAENDARIREQIERDAPACVTDADLAEQRRTEFEEWAREKLSPEEIYPEHFPDPDEYE
jgi:hypothetical protein